jgi:hypothetical protein
MNQMFKQGLSALAAGLALTGTAYAIPGEINIGDTITCVAGAQYIQHSPGYEYMTDGGVLANGAPYDSSVCTYWTDLSTTFQIDLGATYNITGAFVQADWNDTYQLAYHDEANNTWVPFFNAPAFAAGGGLYNYQNRPGTGLGYATVSPFDTDAVRFYAISGDAWLSVNEVALQGTVVPTPEPSAFALMALGLGGAVAAKWRRKQ